VYNVGDVFEAVSETAMLELDAQAPITVSPETLHNKLYFNSRQWRLCALAAGTYAVNLIYYDDVDRPFAESGGNAVVNRCGNDI